MISERDRLGMALENKVYWTRDSILFSVSLAPLEVVAGGFSPDGAAVHGAWIGYIFGVVVYKGLMVNNTGG